MVNKGLRRSLPSTRSVVAALGLVLFTAEAGHLRTQISDSPANSTTPVEERVMPFGLYWKAVAATCEMGMGPCKEPKSLPDYGYPVYYLSPEKLSEGVELGCGMEYYYVDQLICSVKDQTNSFCCQTSWCSSEFKADGNTTCADSRACIDLDKAIEWLPMTMATSTGAVDQHYCHLAFTKAPTQAPDPTPDRTNFKPVVFTPGMAYCSKTDRAACGKMADEYCKRPERGSCFSSAGYTTSLLDPSRPENYRLTSITCLCPPTPKHDTLLSEEVALSEQSRAHIHVGDTTTSIAEKGEEEAPAQQEDGPNHA